MAFWDLNETQRESLKKALIVREAMVKRGINPQSELQAKALCKEYSLTEADWLAVLKAFAK